MSIQYHCSYIVLVILLAMSTDTAFAGDEVWTTVTAGGSTVEVPRFIAVAPKEEIESFEGVLGAIYRPQDSSMELRLYRETTDLDAASFVRQQIDVTRSVITYDVDRPNLAVISGYFEQSIIFYAACRPVAEEMHCLDMTYAVADREQLDPVVSRIAKSFMR